MTSKTISSNVLIMKRFRKITLFKSIGLIFSFFLFLQLSAQSEHPSFEPLFSVADILQKNLETEPYTKYTGDQVFEMGLLFSECQRGSQTWKNSWQKFDAIKKAVMADEIMSLSEEERGRAILKYLYRDYLKNYSLNQTKLDVALETGIYNCVSSAVLYMAAAKIAGLEVRGQKTTQHAFCSIYVANTTATKKGQQQIKKIDVETTNPYGFNPGSKEEVEHSDQIKKYYVVPKKYYANRSEVSDGIFTGLIAGNLTSEYIKQGDYFKALPLGAARWTAVKAEPAKTTASVRNEFDILAGNYVNLVPESAVSYSGILDWFSSFIDRWGKTDFLQKNMDSSFINLLVLCNREKNYQLASTAYEKYKDRISSSQFSKSEEILADILFTSATADFPYEQQIEIIKEMLSSGDYTTDAQQKRGQLYLENAWLNVLNDLMNLREYQAGLQKSDEALKQLPKSTKIKNMRQYFYNNCIALIHNEFAKEANKQNFETALEILNKGLEEFPEDKSLKKDLSDLMKVMGI